MARHRRHGKGRSRRHHRRYRRSTASKALRRVKGLARKMAAEVKKLDANAIIPEDNFVQITNAVGSAADNATSLPDFGYLYKVFQPQSYTSNPAQGLPLGDFIGEQIRAKYLYVGLHLQAPVRPSNTESSPVTIQQPICIRCMVVQDRNYSAQLTFQGMLVSLFGLTVAPSGTGAYAEAADFTLLPINPQEPGRFNVIRDFKMYCSPGWRSDYYKKMMFLQRDLLSGGRFYAGSSSAASGAPPGQAVSTWSNMRNNIYILFLYQSPTIYGANATGTPDFTLSVQSRLAYYDN